MLGDTAVAVHPEDPRYRELVGQACDPAAGRAASADRGRRIFGPGEGHRRGEDHARRTTSTTSPSAQRHGLPMPSILDRQARVALAEIADVLRGSGWRGRSRVRALARRHGPRRGAQGDRGGAGAAGPAGEDGAAHASGAARRPRRRADRAAADGAVVLQRRGAGEAGDRGGGDRQDRVRAEAMGEHVLRLDARHPALVHFAPALVGPSDPRLVRPRRPRVRRRDRGGGRRRWRARSTAPMRR